ncbi:type VI secretion system Vgr family protein [Aquimarina sp. RZ0]|uniref:type VI secretion system Vgr family protein n=1 Tax=Aquimarina sp. RZ0 TaxID=2607730 RepID=UPI0011F13EBF|nr:phage baseplate assembly protein V [Aquimarina sp. RZ0]KAA1242404.1 hypothetical protein F0000_25715 [Aquimarina sp. RZ0]
MATLSTTYISIGNTIISSFQSLKLEQKLSSHHSLSLVCRADVLERSTLELVGDSRDFLAETITVKIKSENDFQRYKELQFRGVVTKVKTIKGFHQATGDLIVIEGKSMSVLSEDGNHSASFVDRNLSEILEQTFKGYDAGKLTTAFAPRTSNTLHYSVQFRESSFSYASRLAAISNNWFYDDGTKLVFGDPGTQETSLTYSLDLQELSIEIEPLPNNFNYFTHDYLSDELYEKKTSEINNSTSGYHNLASDKSASLYAKETKIYHNPYTDTALQQRFDTEVTQHTQAIESNQVIATGISDNPGVNLGEIIKIEGQGSFRVIEVTHTNTEMGNYQNHFKAITTELEVYPLTDMMQYPQSTIEKAEVIENTDPQGLGRVTVQFPWQKQLGETTPFIRVMTAHAGSDRGLYMIPEKGDEVICQFENNNSERPYVVGSFFNGAKRPEQWRTENNDKKAIKTRAGHLLEFTDSKGNEMITITDKNNNVIRIDTANNNIEISALENMTLNAKNMQINIQENLAISVGENKNESIGNKQTLTAKSSTVLIDEKLQLQSKELEKNAEKITINSTKENLELSSAKQVVSNSSEKNILI